MKKPIFFMLSIALFFVACDKDDNGANNTDNLTGSQWKITSSVAKFTFNGVEQTVDVYAQLPACQKDNLVEFKTDGTFIADEGATKCSPNDPQEETGTWVFAQDETHIVVVSDDLNFDAEILELTDSRLRVKYDTDLSGTVTTTETVFEKN